jgi:RimJ/RimL family protein N-acetyltransferase
VIYELQSNEFYKCKPLIHEQRHVEVRAIVEGNNPGRIFVDDPSAPSTALVWFGNLDGFAFIGDPKNEAFNQHINKYFDDVIIPEAKKLDLEWFVGFGDDSAWDTTIEQVFINRQLDASNQKVYMLNKQNYKPVHTPISAEYEILKMTQEMLKSSFYKNHNFLKRKIEEFWTSPDDFIEKGIGYCAIHNKEIVSVCFSGFVAGRIHGIDIETLKEHQGKKLAQKLADAFVTDCIENDQLPYWDCMEVNKPSIAVAEKTGLSNEFNYTVYEFPFG